MVLLGGLEVRGAVSLTHQIRIQTNPNHKFRARSSRFESLEYVVPTFFVYFRGSLPKGHY